MNSYLRNNAGSRHWASSAHRKPILIATIIIVLLFIIDGFSDGGVRDIVRAISARVWARGHAISETVGASGFFKLSKDLAQENESLKRQVAELQERSSAYDALKMENENLRGILRIPGSAYGAGITAPIVSSFLASPYGTFLVGAGSSDGVVSGSLVMSKENFIIGRVEDAGLHTSLVAQIFAPNATFDAFIHGVGVTLEGQGGGNARANAPTGASIAVGDPVIVPQLGEHPVGVVGSIESNSAAGFQAVYVRLPVNLGELQFVYVAK